MHKLHHKQKLEKIYWMLKKEEVEIWNYFKTPSLSCSCRIQNYTEQHINLSLTEARLSVSVKSHTEFFLKCYSV